MEQSVYINQFSDIDLNHQNIDRFKPEELAIDVNNVHFRYTKNNSVLSGLNLKIPRGKIFALLGPNGTGKTTLIRLILGRLRLKEGSIRVFGVRAGSKESDIPGPGAGYMPQELALFDEFSIQEILLYYGTIYNISAKQLNKRIDELILLLNLPEKSRPISQLSGGQQRRVSIAITMIHKPRLIILDEPTVGVDSLLRKRIWNYLENICQNNDQTVLITTHYIEEARSAANVAFMNVGTILEQSNPELILQKHNCKTLEEVFLILCQNKIKTIKSIKSGKDLSGLESNLNDNDENSGEVLSEAPIKSIGKRNVNNKMITSNRIKAMLFKYWILTLRRPLYMVMFYVIPLLVLTTMTLSVGQDPYNIPAAVFNQDKQKNMSQRFIDSIDTNYVIINEYKDNKSAFESVVNGKNFISIVFSENFTDTFESRVTDLLNMDDFEIDNSQIKVYIDFSNAAIGAFVLKYLLTAFKVFCDSLSSLYGNNLFRFLSPVQIEECIYGSLELDVTAHFGPSILIVLAQCLPMVLSAFQIVTDRKTASFERVFVAGVKPIEYFIAHTIQNSVLVVTQASFTMFLAFYVFKNTQLGSYVEVFSLLTFQGLLGMQIGLMGALLLADEVSVAVGVTGTMLPLWIMSGVLWPLEAIPPYFRYIANLSPITLPLDGLRSILLRGWSYDRSIVLYGHLITIFYTIVISLFNLIIFHKFTDKAFTFQFWSF